MNLQQKNYLSSSVSIPRDSPNLRTSNRSQVEAKKNLSNSTGKNPNKKPLTIDQPQQIYFPQILQTPNFKNHRKTGSTHSCVQTQKHIPNYYFSAQRETENRPKFAKKNPQKSLDFVDLQDRTIHSKSIEKYETDSYRDLGQSITTERVSRRKHKKQLIEKLQSKLSDLQSLIDQLEKLKKHSQSNKSLTKHQRSASNISMHSNTNIYKKNAKLNDFIILENKGKGRYGQVYMAIDRRSGAIVALKSQSKAQLRRNNMVDRFILQVRIHFYLNHPNISKLYGIFDDQSYIYMIMEYMHDGSLYQLMKKNRQLPQRQASLKLSSICFAIGELHRNSIIHRDIKPQNIVINLGVCKLCDFGWSVIENDRRQTYCGTFDYIPPQILNGEKYNESIDLWQLGVIAYEMITGQLPFYHFSRKETFLRITNYQNKLTFPKKTSKQAINFISQLLRKNPSERKPIHQLQKHIFLKKYKEDLF